MSEIHVISENDLQYPKKIGKRIRALCPIHNSRDRDLSIAPYSDDGYFDEDEEKLAGFGYCHSANCGATVLVQEWNPKAAANILGHPVQASEPHIKLTAKERGAAEEWQLAELAALNKIYPTARLRLKHTRALTYLEQRGLGSQEALDLLDQLEVAYIPPAGEWPKEPPANLRRWCDRILFPFTCSGGEQGYIGRSLLLWLPGMDENEHKHLIAAHDERMEKEHGKDAAKYQIRRWRKTYKSGFFNASVMHNHNHLYITEGSFDAIPLILVGLPGVIAIAGTHLDIPAIKAAKNVLDITLAFDADIQGKDAIAKTTDQLGGIGVTPVFLVPPEDGRGKDWSERYRLYGIGGLAPLIEPTVRGAKEFTCSACGVDLNNSELEAFYDENGLYAYCSEHWQALQKPLA